MDSPDTNIVEDQFKTGNSNKFVKSLKSVVLSSIYLVIFRFSIERESYRFKINYVYNFKNVI